MRIWNMRNGRLPSHVVRVDRASRWGNPYVIGRDGGRDEVCDQHEVWLRGELERSPDLQREIARLAGKDLGCWCAPLRCHAETLSVLASEYDAKGRK